MDIPTTDQAKINYAVWYQDQLNDFLRGCQARNDTNLDNYLNNLNQWYIFYKQKCSNETSLIENLLEIKFSSFQKIRCILEKALYNDLKECWRNLNLHESNSLNNCTGIFQKLWIFIKDQTSRYQEKYNGAYYQDYTSIVKAAAFSFLSEKLFQEVNFFLNMEEVIEQKKKAETSAENNLSEIHKLNSLIDNLNTEIIDQSAKSAQLQKRYVQAQEEITKLKIKLFDVEKSHDQCPQKIANMEKKYQDASSENESLKDKVAGHAQKIDELTSDQQYLRKQFTLEKENHVILIKQKDEIIHSLQKFHRDEINHLKSKHEQETLHLNLKYEKLESQRTEDIQQVEFIAKAFIEQRQEEMKEALQEKITQINSLNSESGYNKAKIKDLQEIIDALNPRLALITDKYKSLKIQNALLRKDAHNWRGKCNEKDLNIATLQARCSSLKQNIILNDTDLESQKNSFLVNNSIDFIGQNALSTFRDQIKLPNNLDDSTDIKPNHWASTEIYKNVDSSYFLMTRENIRLKEELQGVNQKYKSLEKVKEQKLSRLTEELSTMHFLIKKLKEKGRSKTLSHLVNFETKAFQTQSTHRSLINKLKLNLKPHLANNKTLTERTALNISTLISRRKEKNYSVNNFLN